MIPDGNVNLRKMKCPRNGKYLGKYERVVLLFKSLQKLLTI